MKWNSAYLADGSIHLRLVNVADEHKKYPSYTQHVILEPKGGGLVELKGIVGAVGIDVYKMALEEARKHGFTAVEVFRVKDDKLIKKLYRI